MYIVELNGLHVGAKFGTSKRYRYAGEERVKIKMYEIEKIEHTASSTRVRAFELNEKGQRKAWYTAWYSFYFDQEIELSMTTKKGS